MGRVSFGFSNRTATKNKWNSKQYVRVFINVKRDAPGKESSEKKKLQELAAAEGKSVSRYIVDAINAYAGEQVLSVLDNESKKKKTAEP